MAHSKSVCCRVSECREIPESRPAVLLLVPLSERLRLASLRLARGGVRLHLALSIDCTEAWQSHWVATPPPGGPRGLRIGKAKHDRLAVTLGGQAVMRTDHHH